MSSEAHQVNVSAPGRAGIIGNPTDMYGGAVISCSVDMRAQVQITPAQDHCIRNKWTGVSLSLGGMTCDPEEIISTSPEPFLTTCMPSRIL